MPQDLCNTTMDTACPIAMLLPGTTGMGVCSTSLTFFLVNTHDDFLGTYRSATNQDRYNVDHYSLLQLFDFLFKFLMLQTGAPGKHNSAISGMEGGTICSPSRF